MYPCFVQLKLQQILEAATSRKRLQLSEATPSKRKVDKEQERMQKDQQKQQKQQRRDSTASIQSDQQQSS